jgi:hypothetical protein
MSITALEYFAQEDTHAMQYSLISKSLLSSTLNYLESKETQERLQIKESSSQLFGLTLREEPSQEPSEPDNTTDVLGQSEQRHSSVGGYTENTFSPTNESPFGDIDPSIFSMGDLLTSSSDYLNVNTSPHGQTDQVFGALNLFPLFDGNGHIDLGNYL